MWLYIVLGLLAVIAALVVIISMRPADFRVARSATMAAPPSDVFEQVNSFHKWEHWSPWAKLDPASKCSFDGPIAGEGAYFSWDGNKEVGAGSMKILESRPDQHIRILLDFVRPMKATNEVTFTFTPAGAGTAVTWAMAGKNNFMGKTVSLFMDCEKMVGEQFEKGLANIRSIVEDQGAPVGVGPR